MYRAQSMGVGEGGIWNSATYPLDVTVCETASHTRRFTRSTTRRRRAVPGAASEVGDATTDSLALGSNCHSGGTV
jgi:hypothetical protein